MQIAEHQQHETNTSIFNLSATMTHEDLPDAPTVEQQSMIIGALCTATDQKLRAKVAMFMQNPSQPAEDLVNTRGYKLLLARVTETAKGRQSDESAEDFISRTMRAKAPIINAAVGWQAEAARYVKTHPNRRTNEEVRPIVASGSSRRILSSRSPRRHL